MFASKYDGNADDLVDVDIDLFKDFEGHYDKHVINQEEFGWISEQEYFHDALDLATTSVDDVDVVSKQLSNDREAVYDVLNNEIVIIHEGSYIGTYFSPVDGLDYYNRMK